MTAIPRSVAGVGMHTLAPAGPTVEKFILDFDHRIKAIMGPVGAGKTTGCIQAGDVIAAIQPLCFDGVIRCAGAVIRGTFRELEKTVLKSWFEWFPKEMKDPVTGADMWDFSGGNDRPAVHTRRFKSERGVIETTTQFIGIGNHKIEEITRGEMWTWAWLNELDLMHKDVADHVDQRLPRFPPKHMLADPDNNDPIPFLIGDFNAPDIDNWTYRDFVENPIAGYKLYQQPGGMEPGAENKKNLPRGYYEHFLATKPDWWCRRFVHNKFGYSRHGQPVYPEFNDRKHVAETELMPVPGAGIRLGVDGGGTPAAILMQKNSLDQVRVLDEVVAVPGEMGGIVGPARFGQMVLAVMMQPKYAGCSFELIVADPSTMDGVDREAGDLAWLEIFARTIGVPWQPHYTNEPSARQAPMRWRFTTDIDGKIPAILFSPTCRKTVKGMASGYHHETLRKDPDAPTKAKPEKNDYSHPCEACEYGVASYEDRGAIIARAARAQGAFKQAFPQQRRAAPGNFDPFKF